MGADPRLEKGIGEAMNWIRCADKMPNRHETVLVVYGHHIRVAKYNGDHWDELYQECSEDKYVPGEERRCSLEAYAAASLVLFYARKRELKEGE